MYLIKLFFVVLLFKVAVIDVYIIIKFPLSHSNIVESSSAELHQGVHVSKEYTNFSLAFELSTMNFTSM